MQIKRLEPYLKKAKQFVKDWTARAQTQTSQLIHRAKLPERLEKTRIYFSSLIKNIQNQNYTEKSSKTIRLFGKILESARASIERRGLGFYGKAMTIGLCTYFLSDLTAVVVEKFFPDLPPTLDRSGLSTDFSHVLPVTDYDIIFTRNLFNSRGLIPGEEILGDGSGPAIRTVLPLQLIGTVILEDTERSLATIMDKGSNKVYPVRNKDEIPGKLKVMSVEARKVTFLNLISRRTEYVDLPEDPNFFIPKVGTASVGTGAKIEQTSLTRFTISRSSLETQLADFNKILTEARAIPNIENGTPAGYKLIQIVPGSIYTQLGLQNGDVILSMDGESVNDPGKAFEKLGELKTAKQVEITIKRNGVEQTNTYFIQ